MTMTGQPLTSVLIVDDDPILCEVARSYFHEFGVSKIALARNGQEALYMVDQFDGYVDFILTDLKMPVMDGVQFLSHMHRRAYRGPIGIVSGEGAAVASLAMELARKNGLNVVGTAAKPLNSECLDILVSTTRTPEIPADNNESSAISANELEAAIYQHQVVAYYQPQIDAATGVVSGVEALARLQHPERGIVAPGFFVPVAEERGLMPLLTNCMIKNVLSDIEALNRIDPDLKVSINLGAAVLGDTTFPDDLALLFDKFQENRSRFVLELTESKLVEDSADSMEVLARLNLAGFQLSLDDFGTQFSNIEQLTKFPFKELKIDQSFVRSATTDSRSRATVESCVSLGKQLGMRVVAEGVETKKDSDLLVGLGVDRLQGFLFAKPLPINELVSWAKSYQKDEWS